MARTREGLEKAIELIPQLREEFWANVNVPGSADSLNQALGNIHRADMAGIRIASSPLHLASAGVNRVLSVRQRHSRLGITQLIRCLALEVKPGPMPCVESPFKKSDMLVAGPIQLFKGHCCVLAAFAGTINHNRNLFVRRCNCQIVQK